MDTLHGKGYEKEKKENSFGIGISASCTTGRESDRLGREEKRKKGYPGSRKILTVPPHLLKSLLTGT